MPPALVRCPNCGHALVSVDLPPTLELRAGEADRRAIREGEGWLTTIVLTVAVIVGGIGLIMYLRKQRVLKIGAGITPDQPTITNASQSTLTDDSHSSAANQNGQIGTEQASTAMEKSASAPEKVRPPGN